VEKEEVIIIMTNETFRRAPEVHRPSGQLAFRLARRDAETRSRVQKTGRRKSESPRAETWQQKAEGGMTAFRFRPRAFRYSLETSFRFFCPLRRQFCISKPLVDDLRAEETKSISIVQGIILGCSIVVAENLLIYVTLNNDET
jgi:hypothetical protein